jgi:hypothetical protein
MRFLREDETILHIYKCDGCRNFYSSQVGRTRVSCAVMHPPGTCCHYGEIEVSSELASWLSQQPAKRGLGAGGHGEQGS